MIYLDSSAILRRILRTEWTPHLENYLATRPEGSRVAISTVGIIEVRRVLSAEGATRGDLATADQMLAEFNRVDLTPDVVATATGLADRKLRTLDAIHVASAIDIRATAFVTYDRRMMDAGRGVGLRVEHPGMPAS